MIVAPFDRPEVWVFEVDSGDILATICPELSARRVAVSPDGRLVAIGRNDAMVEVWDLRAVLAQGTPAPCPEAPSSTEDPAVITRIAAQAWIGLEFSPDGSALATASYDGVVGVWDVRTGANVVRFLPDGQAGGASSHGTGPTYSRP